MVKAVIMAAGKGVRMMPLTQNCPKVLVKVNGHPFLHYLLEHLRKAGIEEIALVVGYKKEMIEKYVKEQGIKATLIEQKEQLGTGDAVKKVQRFVGNDDFICMGGDNIFSTNDIKSIMKKDRYQYIVGFKTKDWKRYGILLINGGFLNQIVEKPTIFVGNYANVGLYKFTPEIFDALMKIQRSPRGEYELTDAITALAKEKKVKVRKLKDYWIDLGAIDDLPKVRSILRRKRIC